MGERCCLRPLHAILLKDFRFSLDHRVEADACIVGLAPQAKRPPALARGCLPTTRRAEATGAPLLYNRPKTMWTWRLNWGRVRDDIVVGSCPLTPSDIDAIQSGTGATAILSVQCDECRAAFRIDLEDHVRHAGRRGVVLRNAPMRDFDVEDQRRHLVDAVVSLARLLLAGHSVYVHCTAGINRAPLTVLGYLTFVEGLRPNEALATIRAGRPQAEPYWEAWRGCRSDLVDKHRPAIEARAWELSQRHPEASSLQNWGRAEVAVLREVLLAAAAATGARCRLGSRVAAVPPAVD